MRNRWFWLIALCLVSSLWVMPTVQAVQRPIQPTVDLVQFRTQQPTTVDELWSIINQFDLTLVRLETAYTMGDREWFDTLYAPDTNSVEELLDNIIQARSDTWNSLLDSNAWEVDEVGQYEAALTFLRTPEVKLDAPQVFSVMLAGQRSNLVRAIQILAENQTVPFLSDLIQLQSSDSARNTATTAAPSNETWLPENGSVTTGPSSTSGYRYVTQKLKWDDKSGFQSSGNYSTYEHEFFLYNYNDSYAGTYLTTASTAWPNCYPNLKSSSYNYPSSAYAYLDTRLTMSGTCPSTFNEVEYTHGLVFASKISANTTYTVTMTAANGSKSSDEFKLQGDIGYCPYSTSDCAAYLTWGVYSHGLQTRIQPDDSSWDHTVPGTKSWTE